LIIKGDEKDNRLETVIETKKESKISIKNTSKPSKPKTSHNLRNSRSQDLYTQSILRKDLIPSEAVHKPVLFYNKKTTVINDFRVQSVGVDTITDPPFAQSTRDRVHSPNIQESILEKIYMISSNPFESVFTNPQRVPFTLSKPIMTQHANEMIVKNYDINKKLDRFFKTINVSFDMEIIKDRDF